MEFKPTAYTLQSCASKREFADSGWMLADKEDSSPAFVRAIYQNKQINFKDNSYGIYKFADWLPIHKMLEGSCAPVTYKSEGATMQTCSFKETEAYSVCARLPKDNDKILVVASAGNTARAFAKVCSENNIPIVIAIPYDNLNALWFKEPLNDCVKIICSPANTDYFDAIALAAKLNSSSKFIEEGGAKNVARRDGMGTTVLSAAEHIGRIPDSYFQAIGSGTGTIAAYEANLRLIEDGRFGNHLMKLIPSQNLPFVPMYDAWKADSRALLIADEDKAREDALKITAKVLSNRKPPYGIVGGLYDCLKATNGDIEVVTNEELDSACKLFEDIEGCDIHPAAGVAVCSLIKAVESGKVSKDEVIMLNITGGGEKRFKNEHKCIEVKPHLVIDAATSAEDVCAAVEGLFK